MIRNALNRTRAGKRHSDAGFTLIELLIVIVILGILAAIVVFSVKGITDKGQTSACKTTQSTIDTAFEAYAASLDDPSSAATTKLVASLAPPAGVWLHSVPADNTVIGKGAGKITFLAASTTVADIDGATC